MTDNPSWEYRERAARYRAEARICQQSDSRQALIRVAAEYELTAQILDRRAGIGMQLSSKAS